jgi:hypothetical protein
MVVMVMAMPNSVDEQVGLVKPKRRWLFFGGEGGQEKDAAPKDKTLADLWVEFLLQEASESTTPATPATPATHDTHDTHDAHDTHDTHDTHAPNQRLCTNDRRGG